MFTHSTNKAHQSPLNPKTLTLQEALALVPVLSTIHDEACTYISEHCLGTVPDAICVDIATDEVSALINAQSSLGRALAVFVSSDFESELELIARRNFSAFCNVASLDKLEHFPCLAITSGDKAILIPEHGFVDALSSFRPDFTAHAPAHAILNLIIVSGGAVLILGVPIDETEISDLQVLSAVARDATPQEIYTEQELADAANSSKNLGPWYWYKNFVEKPYLFDTSPFNSSLLSFCLRKF